MNPSRRDPAFTRAAFYAKIGEYFHAGIYTDVNIRCQGDERVFKCHRVVLAAVSEYFNASFGGNFGEGRLHQDIVLHSIDSSIFELLLQYMYSGDIPTIADNNVWAMLRSADYLYLDEVVERCTHYLVENTVPVDDALHMFSFSCTTKKMTLISCSSRHISENLDYYSSRDEFFNLYFDDIRTLLDFVSPASCPEKEYSVLKAIRRWVSNLRCLPGEKNTMFLELTQNIRFKYNPVVFFDEIRDEDVLQPASFIDSDIMDRHVPCHVLMDFYYPNYRPGRRCLFTIDRDTFAWSYRFVKDATVRCMRTIALHDRLYRLQSHMGAFKLITATSRDFGENTRSLTSPPRDFLGNSLFPNFSLCCHKDSIYSCNGRSRNIFNYNCELDQWFAISFATDDEEYLPTFIASCHNQLYVVCTEPNSSSVKAMRAYDARCEKLQVLPSCQVFHTSHDEICTHREKVYLSGTELASCVEVYNPVASKWDVILKREQQNHQYTTDIHRRLVSVQDELWLFTTRYLIGNSQDRRVRFDHLETVIWRYDSFHESWDSEYGLDDAIYQKTRCSARESILDAFVCQM